MKTAEEILLQHFGCIHQAQLCNGYGINLTQQEIIKNAMKRYTEQFIDKCANEAKTHLAPFTDEHNILMDKIQVDKQSILNVKSELK